MRKYLDKCEEKLLVTVRNEELLGEGKEKQQLQQQHMERYTGKSLYGKLIQNTSPGRDDKTWDWLKKGNLKKETEGMLMVVQELALRTRFIRSKPGYIFFCSGCQNDHHQSDCACHKTKCTCHLTRL